VFLVHEQTVCFHSTITAFVLTTTVLGQWLRKYNEPLQNTAVCLRHKWNDAFNLGQALSLPNMLTQSS